VDATVDADVDAPVDADVDASVDADVDASVDADVDASVDADVDASVDADVDASVDADVDASVVLVEVVVVVVGNRVVIPAFSFFWFTAAALRLCRVAVEVSRFTPAWESITPTALTADVRAGLLLFTIFFNSSQTCPGVTDEAIP